MLSPGYGYFGQYYQIHNILEPATCPCDAELQTREHMVFEYQTYEEHRNIINEGAPEPRLARFFGPKAGTEELTEIVKKRDPSKPIGGTSYKAERSGGATEQSNGASRTTRTQREPRQCTLGTIPINHVVDTPPCRHISCARIRRLLARWCLVTCTWKNIDLSLSYAGSTKCYCLSDSGSYFVGYPHFPFCILHTLYTRRSTTVSINVIS